MKTYTNTPFAALMFDELEDYEVFIEELTEFINLNNSAGAAFNNRAVANWEIGKVEDALRDFDSAIANLPNNHLPSQNKGMMLHKLGRLKEAIESLNLAVEIREDLATLRRTRAHILIDAGMLEEALKDFEIAIKIDPSFQNTKIERDNLIGRIRSMSSNIQISGKSFINTKTLQGGH